jgi:acetyltransferase
MVLLNEWIAQTQTRGGVALNIRPVSPGDKNDILTFLKSVNADDLRFRFLSAVQPTEALARILTDVDHRSAEDLIAFDARDGSIAATAMIADGSSPQVAETAIVVRSDLKDRGIGWVMLQQACDYARERGYRRVECVESSSHLDAISLELEQGFKSHADPRDATITVLARDLPSP